MTDEMDIVEVDEVDGAEEFSPSLGVWAALWFGIVCCCLAALGFARLVQVVVDLPLTNFRDWPAVQALAVLTVFMTVLGYAIVSVAITAGLFQKRTFSE